VGTSGELSRLRLQSEFSLEVPGNRPGLTIFA
jgi:hypothetical protein